VKLPGPTRHLLPSRAIPSDGSLSPDSCRARRILLTAELGPVSRASSVHTVMRNYTGDEGRTFEVGNQVLISSHRKLLWSKATVVNVAEKSKPDFDKHDWQLQTYPQPSTSLPPSATVRSGAQSSATNAPMSSTGASATHRITMTAVFMALLRLSAVALRCSLMRATIYVF
jgi:hypothetical protein